MTNKEMTIDQLEHAAHLLQRAADAIRLVADINTAPEHEDRFALVSAAIDVDKVRNWVLGQAHAYARMPAEKDDLAKSVDLCREALAKLNKPAADEPADPRGVPPEVHESGWQWRPCSENTAFAPPFGTIRVCAGCGSLIAGGPTRCTRCARDAAMDPDQP